MKRIPLSIQGLLFAPALIGIIFVLKITCPAPTGEGCFADNFLTPTFMPLNFLYKVFDKVAPTLALHEPLFILGYWALVGFLAGLTIDIFLSMKKNSQREVSRAESEDLY